MTTYYVDNMNGSDSNNGTTEALAKQTLSAGCGLLAAAGDILYIQNTGTPYTLTTSVALTLKGTTAGGCVRIEGYTTTPGARDGRPLITTATNSTPLFTCNGLNYNNFAHLSLSNTASTRSVAFQCVTANSTTCKFEDCIFDGFSFALTAGTSSWLNPIVMRCEFKNGTGSTNAQINTAAGGMYFGNYFHDNAGDGIVWSYAYGCFIIGNIFANNGRYGAIENSGSSANVGYAVIHGDTFYGNGSDGLRITADTDLNYTPQITNNIFYGNGGYGQNWPNLSSTEESAMSMIKGWNAYGANTSGNIAGVSAGISDVTLTGDPFINATAKNFALNTIAGAGAACRAAGFPGAFPAGVTTGYVDIGAAQHQDTGGGGLACNPVGGFIG